MSSSDEDFAVEATSSEAENLEEVEQEEEDVEESDHDTGPTGRSKAAMEREIDPFDTRSKLAVNVADLSSTFKILIATDNHLGYMERDGVRSEDSFAAFEEILKIAKDQNVDFIVLGGDLFHENKPSRKCLHTTLTLLRQYCLGDKPCPIEFLSDQSVNFPDRFATVNYQDPNFNVGIPVFSIHGNHDEPSGPGGLAALDLLSAAGLVNYFGQQEDLENVEIKPLLMRKGDSFLSLYGLGNIRDDRLNRTFENKKVTMFRPSEDTESWFNMLVLHQNRAAHSVKNYLPTEYLEHIGSFLDLVLWGHEHECKIDPSLSGKDSFFISQPGSSVATSLCEGEAVPKNVGILHIKGQEFQLEKIPLKTVRPFVMDTLVLANIKKFDKLDQPGVERIISEKVHELIDRARVNWRKTNPIAKPEQFPKPLIRLKVDYSGGFTSFNPRRFGQKFVDIVANAADVIYFFRKKAPVKRTKRTDTDVNIDDLLPDRAEDLLVETLVHDMLTKTKLEFLPENEFIDIVTDFVHNGEKDAIQVYLNSTLKRTKVAVAEVLKNSLENDATIKEEILKAKEQRCDEYASIHAPRTITHGTAPPKNEFPEGIQPHLKLLDAQEVDEDFEGTSVYFPDTKKARGKAATKTAPVTSGRTTKPRASAASKKKAAKEVSDSDEIEDDDISVDQDDDEVSIVSNSRAKAARGGRKAAVNKPDMEEDIPRSSKGRASSNRVIDSDDDDDDMEVDVPVPAVKKPGRRRAPAAPAVSKSSSKGSTVSQSLKSSWPQAGIDDDDDIEEIKAPLSTASSSSKTVPKKRSAPAQSAAAASKRVPLSQNSVKQTSILGAFSQRTSATVASATAAKPGRGQRKNPF